MKEPQDLAWARLVFLMHWKVWMWHIKKTLNHPKADPEKRSTFCRKVEELEKECRSIVYIDESGFAHDMPRTHGYSVKGKRCYDKHDWGAKGRTNAIGALIGSTLVAVGLLTGSVNTDVFTTWVDKILLPNIPEKALLLWITLLFIKELIWSNC